MSNDKEYRDKISSRMYTSRNSPYGQDQVLESEVLSATPAKLVQILYTAAADAVQGAMSALEQGDIRQRAQKIQKATAILSELTVSLDVEKSGEWGRNLIELYDYMTRRLNQANFEQRREPLEEVRKLLNTLQQAWTEISGQATPQAAEITASQGSGFERVDHLA